MTKEENINIKIQNGEKLTLTEAMSVLKCYHFDWRCSQALDVVLESVNPWCYPSKGEYPPLTNHKSWSDDVLCECTDGKYRVGHYINTMGHKYGTQWDNWRFEFGMERKGIVLRWRYIVPPGNRRAE